MKFPEILAPDAPALRDDRSERFVSYGELKTRAAAWAARLDGSKALVFLYVPNRVDGVAALLGAWQAGHAVALLDPGLGAEGRIALFDAYLPEYVIADDADGNLDVSTGKAGPAPHQDLTLLLSTSGSTGSPKFVRLTSAQIRHNAEAIADVLDIRADEVGCGHLPLHYSYGLSILTSHLVRGAPVLLTERSFTDRAFWTQARAAKVAHMPGVPFHFQMMQRLRYERLDLPDLRVLTQAGGGLSVEERRAAHSFMDGRGGRFYVMYGQTEAAPRMTTLAHEDFPLTPDSVGTALPGGRLEIVDDQGEAVAPGENGLVIYRGPNVMWGYAERREDLALGDTNKGRLETGDIGRLDAAGRLTISGRAKRFGKIYGLRVNLDEIERAVAGMIGRCAVVQTGELLHIAHVDPIDGDVVARLADLFTIPRTAYRLHQIDAIPYTGRGKVDYRKLEREL
ncbi:AMP-binding protein [Sphingopyxis terrae]|uniref:AMP-binding protein n=1 Tax=Sphingopyxis terrae TaxID=33052 RepID=UPI0007886EAC|nr:AMP-binding protein [Sphingopyxis terrae]